MTPTRRPNRNSVQSLQRALDVLEVLSGAPHGVPLTDLANATQLPPSTVHRILLTLVHRGYVTQDASTARYRVGIRLFEVGSAFPHQLRLNELAHPLLMELAQWSSEAVNLAIRDGNDVVYLDQVEGAKMARIFTRPGARIPLFCSGVGKLFLTALSPEALETLWPQLNVTAYTPHTITTLKAMQTELRRTRARGFALDNQEHELGVRCIAAPVHNHRSELVCAISISIPATRRPGGRVEQFSHKILGAAAHLSKALGYTAPASF